MALRWLFLFTILLAGCSSNPAPPQAETPAAAQAPQEPKKYELRGEVQRLDSQGKIATIKHQAIGDWMGAMTMEFPVKDQTDFDKLKEGQRVDATVYVQGLNYWVGDVKDSSNQAQK